MPIQVADQKILQMSLRTSASSREGESTSINPCTTPFNDGPCHARLYKER